ncbi:divergent protein kinase domain 1C isoform X1 [Frankliniella occidentalis]|uniref:Divergent protein kinase domain 1C isoform X1 n=2 Tax=Frankliniella occidentalis TaxID=133901 RepID=A0A6J1SG73_FRAOC|nr:divergent protein kinase domain 1C isoform X1 [Frankliniella occidentalis]
MLVIRRLPSLIYRHRQVTCGLILTGLFLVCVIYLLMDWGVVCSNVLVWRHVNKLCDSFAKEEIVGNLCPALCVEQKIRAPACHTFRGGKEAIFSAEKDDGTQLIFKYSAKYSRDSALSETMFQPDSFGRIPVPTEVEYKYMLQELLVSKLNTSVSEQQVTSLMRTVIQHESTHPSYGEELLNLWLLAHDHEFVCSALFGDRGVFPRLLGVCGKFYAVEYLEPLPADAGWPDRVRLAVMTLELLEQLETDLPEPFHLCDVKMDHFGIAPGAQRIKFLDLDSVLPRKFASHITGDGRLCERHADCDFFDCRSRCGDLSGTCDYPVTNNNLQIVCEKLFVGWTMSGTVVVPGLLMSPKTSSSLSALLRLCSNPDSETNDLARSAASDHTRRRLYSMLSEMYSSLSLLD